MSGGAWTSTVPSTSSAPANRSSGSGVSLNPSSCSNQSSGCRWAVSAISSDWPGLNGLTRSNRTVCRNASAAASAPIGCTDSHSTGLLAESTEVTSQSRGNCIWTPKTGASRGSTVTLLRNTKPARLTSTKVATDACNVRRRGITRKGNLKFSSQNANANGVSFVPGREGTEVIRLRASERLPPVRVPGAACPSVLISSLGIDREPVLASTAALAGSDRRSGLIPARVPTSTRNDGDAYTNTCPTCDATSSTLTAGTFHCMPKGTGANPSNRTARRPRNGLRKVSVTAAVPSACSRIVH